MAEHVTESELLRRALKWALGNGIKAVSWDDVDCFKDRGCGCCSSSEVPPEDIDAIVRAVRFELIAERKI